jgi:hypothetical protein
VQPTTGLTHAYISGMTFEELSLHKSESIAGAKYDAEAAVLRVTYKSKTGADARTYEYLNVPANVVEDLVAADSHGRFVNRNIKPHYEVRDVI